MQNLATVEASSKRLVQKRVAISMGRYNTFQLAGLALQASGW